MKNDNYTSTVDGAEGFERLYGNQDYDDNRPSLCDLVDDNDELEDDYDECNCSDPGCPCGGIKRGGC